MTRGEREGWFEEYATCGCVSDPVRLKRELVGYCAKHGGGWRVRYKQCVAVERHPVTPTEPSHAN